MELFSLLILTKDSVTTSVDAVVYYRVSNATVSVANVENAHHSTRLLAQTTLRNMLGTRSLSEILSDRDAIAISMQVGQINITINLINFIVKYLFLSCKELWQLKQRLQGKLELRFFYFILQLSLLKVFIFYLRYLSICILKGREELYNNISSSDGTRAAFDQLISLTFLFSVIKSLSYVLLM
uniref:PHB domain-containing protein n=1 Tax=Heterorhabditis bacteriophora TaxID=37862 RepID=A0A1I7X5X3_HETBA